MNRKESFNLFLWAGEKHSGKTTVLGGLVESAKSKGFQAGGILAPSRYEQNELLGFDIINISTNERTVLSQKDDSNRFVFTKEGKLLGQKALNYNSVKNCDLIIIDEFGPMELNSGGWRKEVDEIIAKPNNLIIIVVRNELVEKVKGLLNVPRENILISNEDSTNFILTVLKERK